VRHGIVISAILAALLVPCVVAVLIVNASQEKKDYLTESEADKIRDAGTPSQRINLYLSFAGDRLQKFQYELKRAVPERRRSEILNSLLNAYSACVDDAADQIAIAQERQVNIHDALTLMQSKGKEFLEALDKIQKDGTDLEVYKETLEDAIEGTKDALADADKASKDMLPPPVRRKQP